MNFHAMDGKSRSWGVRLSPPRAPCNEATKNVFGANKRSKRRKLDSRENARPREECSVTNVHLNTVHEFACDESKKRDVGTSLVTSTRDTAKQLRLLPLYRPQAASYPPRTVQKGHRTGVGGNGEAPRIRRTLFYSVARRVRLFYLSRVV